MRGTLMLATLFLAGAFVFGFCLARRALRGLLGGAEQILWGVVGGWTLATLLVYALARAQGKLTYATVAWATAVVWVAAALLAWPAVRRAKWRARSMKGTLAENVKARLLSNAGLLLVLAAFAPVFWILLSSRAFEPGEGGLYSGGSAWHDLSFHASVAASFLHGENFPPVYTPLPPEPLLYPFMPDFQAAALMASGLSLRASFLLTGLVLSLATAGLFYSFALRLTRTRRGAALTSFLFLLNGGLGFVYMLGDWRASGHSFLEFWGSLGTNYANAWERGIHWTNLVADTLVPQRTSLFGLPLGLMVFTIFAAVWARGSGVSEGGKDDGDAIEAGKDNDDDSDEAASEANEAASEGKRAAVARGDSTLLLAAGVLAGLLPLFHTHTYVAVGFVSVLLFILRPRRAWLAFWIPALLLAAPQLLSLARHAAEAEGVVRLQPGWMGHGEANFAAYLLRNFGLPLLLAVPALLAAPRAWRVFYSAFAALFAFAFVVVVSPNLFDNGKLTYYWHAVNSAFVGAWLVRLASAHKARPLGAALAALLAIACVASGLTAIRSEARTRSVVFTDEDLKAAEFVRASTPPRALFLTAPVTNHPVLSLAGRAVVRGPTGWLWSHGYEFRSREADARAIYAGGAAALELLRHYGVGYVYLGDAERAWTRTDAAFFDANSRAVYRSANVTIYDVRAAPEAEHRVAVRAPAPREMASRLARDPYQLLAEFPRTSFFVYRIFKASRGEMPRREEFMAAMRVVGRGLFVGAQGWEQKLEDNRLALAREFAEGEEFKGRFGGLSNADYVRALMKNAGMDGDGGALISSLESGAETRAGVLLRVAEDGGFYEREYDAAYVLVHFFGYLGRDPGSPPDRDLSGFDFWREILSRSGDYRSVGRAFLESEEYKRRRREP